MLLKRAVFSSIKPRHQTRKRVLASLQATLLVLLPFTAHAWDATGHRLTADVAWELMSSDTREQFITILKAHPRFDQDFTANMPDNIKSADSDTQSRWLLGQAAIWPDTARGLEGDDQQRFDNPNWHWIDGAWVRDETVRQGNVYVNTEPRPDIQGIAAEQIRERAHVDNVANGLDFAIYQLRNATDPQEQAVALSWLLHLIGDVHQPLHTGGLVSERLFPEGDRGGNGTRVNNGNLHSTWDRALREIPVTESLPALLAIATEMQSNSDALSFRPTFWLQQSRDILVSTVYPQSIIDNVLRSENTGSEPGTITLSAAYEQQMRDIATRRIAEAGARIAHTLENL
ncbi:hypothetical protein E3V39_00575 [Gammaproteobacteria bacterium LSUCC0112]|nr:hypothetical protein E3V39_00575 [Gammaproteobacteria bacterium LSUCC0112]